MSLFVGDSSLYKAPNKIFVGDDGLFKEVKKAWVGDSGIWKEVYSSSVPPVLWNKLGSQTEVENSEIGEDGVVVGTPTYPTAKFDGGVSNNNIAGNHVYFPNIATWLPTLSNSAGGCIECWVKMNTGATYGTIFTMSDGLADNIDSSYLYFYLTNDNPAKLAIQVKPNGQSTLLVNQTINSPTLTLGTLYHAAVTWDFVNGIDGSSNTLRVYLDGSMIYSNDITLPTTCVYRSEDSLWSINHPFLERTNNLVVDNLKIYDYAKTDFSDRFIEGV